MMEGGALELGSESAFPKSSALPSLPGAMMAAEKGKWLTLVGLPSRFDTCIPGTGVLWKHSPLTQCGG